MITFVLLAFRNVFRNRRRTILSLMVVSGGMMGLLLVGGFFTFMFLALQETTIQSGTGHLQIDRTSGTRTQDGLSLVNGLENYQEIIARTARTPHVKGVVPRIQFYGMLSNGPDSSVFTASAVDPLQEQRLGFRTRIVDGSDLDAGSSGRNEVLLGAGLASALHARPGTTLSLLASTAQGALNGIDVVVKGTMNTGFKEMDDRLVRLPLEPAQRLLQSRRVSNLVVGLDRTSNTDAVNRVLASELRTTNSNLEIRTWVQLSPYYRQVRLMFSGIFLFLGVIVTFMVVVSSANTLLASLLERTRETGAMLAMGTPRSWLVSLFLTEAVIVGLLGAAGGIICSLLIGAFLERVGWTLPPPPGNTLGLPLKVRISTGLMIGSSALVVVTLTLASIVPAIRSARLRIVEALAHV